MNSVEIEAMKCMDYQEIYQLWLKIEGFAIKSVDDSEEGIERFINRNPGISVIAKIDDKIVGSILCGHDGRRGCLYHVCVDPDYRMLGIGKQMVNDVLERLKQEQISKVHLLAFCKNEGGNQFWKELGWNKRDDINYYEYVLDTKNNENIVERGCLYETI